MGQRLFPEAGRSLTIDGEDYTAADVQFYYNSIYQTTAMYAQYGMVEGFDSTLDPKDQIQDEETGTTWYDYFLQSAIEELTQNTMIRHEAEEQGYTLSALGQAYVDQQLEQLESQARSSGYSVKSYLHMNFGSYVDKATYTKIVTNDAIATYYQNDRQSGLTYSDEELEAYYQEHADELDTYNYSVLTIQANVPTETDEEGNTIEMTDERSRLPSIPPRLRPRLWPRSCSRRWPPAATCRIWPMSTPISCTAPPFTPPPWATAAL